MDEFLAKVKADSDEKLLQREDILRAREHYFKTHKAPRPDEDSYECYLDEMRSLTQKLVVIWKEKNRRRARKLRAQRKLDATSK